MGSNYEGLAIFTCPTFCNDKNYDASVRLLFFCFIHIQTLVSNRQLIGIYIIEHFVLQYASR